MMPSKKACAVSHSSNKKCLGEYFCGVSSLRRAFRTRGTAIATKKVPIIIRNGHTNQGRPKTVLKTWRIASKKAVTTRAGMDIYSRRKDCLGDNLFTISHLHLYDTTNPQRWISCLKEFFNRWKWQVPHRKLNISDGEEHLPAATRAYLRRL